MKAAVKAMLDPSAGVARDRETVGGGPRPANRELIEAADVIAFGVAWMAGHLEAR